MPGRLEGCDEAVSQPGIDEDAGDDVADEREGEGRDRPAPDAPIATARPSTKSA